jgi:hypothetical protein
MTDEWPENRIFRGKLLSAYKAVDQTGAMPRTCHDALLHRASATKESRARKQAYGEVVDERIAMGRYYCGGNARGGLREHPRAR